MRYYLGLDNGGTMTKAAIFDAEGHEIAAASTETKAITPKPGFIERDMEEMWRANCSVIAQVLEKSGVDAGEIAAVAVCGHGKGLYLWGKDGKSIRNGIISTDNRAYAYPQRWNADGTAQKVFDITCQHILSCQPVSLLAWLRDNEPESYRNIQWVFECKDYVRFRLTGEARAEITDYSGANLLNLRTKAYDSRLLTLFELEEIADALPPLCGSTEICGRISVEASIQCGLRAGTPVAGGMFDIDACAIAVGLCDERNICMIAGTWSINEYLRREPVTDGRVLMNSLFCMSEYYLIEESSPTSAGNHEWFIKTLLSEASAAEKQAGRSAYAAFDRWVEDIPPETFCPVFLPFLLASNVHPNAKGSFVGISSYHTRAHLLRSVCEGVAFSHKYHLDKLLATRQSPPQCIRLAGGVARSAVWTQMFADVMQLPVETVDTKETGALGCAIAAAVAAGDYATLKQAAAAMCRASPAINPRSEYAAAYLRKYDMYRKTNDALDCIWSDMQALIEGREPPCWKG